MEGVSATASCQMIDFPLPVTQTVGSKDPVYWSDHPDRVLARLRSLYGLQWWR